MKKFIFLLALIALARLAQAQDVPILEKGHDIGRKAKRGYLGQVTTNPQNQTFAMHFVLPSSARKLVVETYTFDKDLNLLNTEREEDELERIRLKYRWVRFRGEKFTTTLLSASANLAQRLVFRKKAVTFSWSWWWGGYNKTVKLLEKVKPTDSEKGEKYLFFGGYYENYADSSLLVLGGVQPAKNSMGARSYDVLHADNRVNITNLNTLAFDHPMWPVFSAPLRDEAAGSDDEAAFNENDWVLVFAPTNLGGKDAAPSTTDYEYLRLSAQGQVKERLKFKSPTNGWRVGMAFAADGVVTLVGAAINEKPEKKYFNNLYPMGTIPRTTDSEEDREAGKKTSGLGALGGAFGGIAQMGGGNHNQTAEQLEDMLDDLKYSNFQVARVEGGQVKFITAPNIDEFAQKQAKPADQKKFVEFDGKKFDTYGTFGRSSGEFWVTGQDFKKDKSGRNQGQRLYRGAYIFHFGANGQLLRNYGVEIDQKKAGGLFNGGGPMPDQYPTRTSLERSHDGQREYAFMQVLRKFDPEDGRLDPLYTIQYGAVDLQAQAMSEFKVLGEDANRNFYLFRGNQPKKLRLGVYQIFLSENLSGSKIMLSRFDLTK
jgi:hypothetical protein